MTNQGGGGAGAPVEWTQVWNSASVATLASGAFISFPFDQYVPGVPHRSWLSFTTVNGSIVLLPGIYLLLATFSYNDQGGGRVEILAFAFNGPLECTYSFPGSGNPGGRNVSVPASGFIDTGQPLDFRITNFSGLDLTTIDGIVDIIKLS